MNELATKRKIKKMVDKIAKREGISKENIVELRKKDKKLESSLIDVQKEVSSSIEKNTS